MIFQPYGTTIAISILIGAWVSSRVYLSCGRNPEIMWDVLLWILPFGLIGARLYHVINYWDYYRQNIKSILYLGNGGLAIYGAVFGGLVGFFLFTRYKKMNGLERGLLLDASAFGLVIGQSLGRFANYFSYELYGWPTSLPWGIYIPLEKRFPGLESFRFFHPLFLYESLWLLIVFVLLYKISKTKKFKRLPGELFIFYLALYALGRLVLEGLRITAWSFNGIRVAQVLSVVIIFVSIVFVVARRSRQARQLAMDV